MVSEQGADYDSHRYPVVIVRRAENSSPIICKLVSFNYKLIFLYVEMISHPAEFQKDGFCAVAFLVCQAMDSPYAALPFAEYGKCREDREEVRTVRGVESETGQFLCTDSNVGKSLIELVACVVTVVRH